MGLVQVCPQADPPHQADQALGRVRKRWAGSSHPEHLKEGKQFWEAEKRPLTPNLCPFLSGRENKTQEPT